MSFLRWEDEASDPAIGDVQIVLVAEDFSKELTTSVLWLIDKGLNAPASDYICFGFTISCSSTTTQRCTG